MKDQPFVIERTFHAPVEKVWKAITDKDQMKQWYFDIQEFKPVTGFEFQFTGIGSDGTPYVHLCKIMEVVEKKKLKYSWRYEGKEGNSYVTFELFAEGEKTRLKLTHEGLESFHTFGKDFQKESFAQGWTELIGSLLKNFVEDVLIKKSIEIKASPSRVWEVLVNDGHVKQWANAFSPGAYVETDWKKGSEVLWKDKDGNVGVKGIVEASDFASLLKVAFYDDANATPPAKPGPSSEIYRLSASDGKTVLSIESGPLSGKDAASHDPLWDKALSIMKELAEK